MRLIAEGLKRISSKPIWTVLKLSTVVCGEIRNHSVEKRWLVRWSGDGGPAMEFDEDESLEISWFMIPENSSKLHQKKKQRSP